MSQLGQSKRLGAMLHQECTVKDGGIEQTHLHTYQPLRISEMPKVETLVLPSAGLSEPTIAVAAPAVLHAIFNATGKRVRNLLLGKQEVKA